MSTQRLQLRLHARRQRISIDVQQHRNEIVVAGDANQIDDTAFAELVLCRLERLIADLFVGQQLGAEVVDRFLIRLALGYNVRVDVVNRKPAEFSALIKQELAQWGTVIRKAGIKPQ